MKFIIGHGIGTIGAYLWQNGGWTGDERYKDLKVTGKLGYHMFCAGLRLMGVPIDELENMVSQ